ncbi:4'-phosphopantetheinyl transferase family protein [Bacillus cereus]|uniref:4'-phosphopantetheinyl transferase family protein n=1 Tax=Bacillus cereus TaxID=1396 RepID=UPI003D0163BC
MIIGAVRLKELEKSTINLIYTYLERDRQIKLQSFYNPKDMYRALIGDILSRVMLSERLGIAIRDLSIKQMSYGKPYVRDVKCHFNISHSGEWIVCSVAESPVGIDIENIQPVDFNIARRFFSRYEIAYLDRISPVIQKDYFWKIWTLKESYLKAIGTGFYKSLDSFSIQIGQDNQISLHGTKNTDIKFKAYDLFEDYKLAVCSYEVPIPENITILSLDTLLDLFQLYLK